LGVPAGCDVAVTGPGYGDEVSDAGPTPQWRSPWDPAQHPGEQASPWTPNTDAYSGPRPAPYGSDPYAAPAYQPAPVERPVVELADVWTAILGTVGVLLVGVLATFVWVWVAPRVIAVKDAKGGVSLASGESKAFAGADVTYLFVTLGAGILCAVVAALVARHRGLAVSVAMGGGGIVASLMVAWLGRWLTGGPLHRWADHASVGSHQLFIQLQTRPFIVAWPMIALAITFAVALANAERRSAASPHQAMDQSRSSAV
jgi:hypothetical protein